MTSTPLLSTTNLRRAALLTVALAGPAVPGSAFALEARPPVNCSVSPDAAASDRADGVVVGTPIVLHAQAPANARGSVHWYVGYGSDPDGAPLRAVGVTDGPGSTIAIPHSPSVPGAQRAIITYRDDDTSATFGDVETPCGVTFYARAVPNGAPTAVLDAPATITAKVPATFDAGRSTDPEGQPLRYQFDLDNDGAFEVDNGTSPVVTYAFPQSGTRIVQVRVTDPAGQIGDAQLMIRIAAPGPVSGPGKPGPGGPGPGGPGPDTAGPDRVAPSAIVRVSTVLNSIESLAGGFAIAVDPSEDLTYTGRVTMRYKGRTLVLAATTRRESLFNSGGGFVRRTIPRGSTTTFVLANTLRKGTVVPVTVTLKLRDGAGNTSTVTRVVKLKKRYEGSGRRG
ncbi:hypothetical protein DSM112329_03363 [Paraconexibacter sp. AEG42_29]|uniref:PKD/Chitinase domain-containing protein n=1 Tax=Paraconexibacter sp. AEG42_29 TaxID=2997339 RepID=A0AAU7AXY2_9ACTN